ncbi:CDP-diacylglycerol--glycerol-3-phosphate 3-phosphatidyltransferase [hydrothermal vent metagenome]|uniref:CDP-diacylglycerol--glycerol-3-phosphate 3-phosphatidyltransferase n=1 Tax=hydrothermal vent metagenome TaxID=652676 RepID=A0A1W1CL45_9ZZZZ
MFNLPNILTLSRIVAIPIFVVLYFYQPYYSETPVFSWVNFWLVAVFAITSITDYLDGYLARKMQLTSKLGAFLDPVADKLMVSTALVLLVDFYQMWFITVASLIIIMREIIVSALREWMSSLGESSSIKVAWLGKVKTFVQIFAILFLLYQQSFFGLPSFEIGIVLLFFATILTIWSGFIYLKIALKSFDS